MYPFYVDPRSDNDYGDSDYGGPEPASGCLDFLEFVFLTPVVFVFMSVMMAGLLLALTGYVLSNVYEMLSFPLVLALGFILIYTILPGVALGLHSLLRIPSCMKTRSLNVGSFIRYLAVLAILLSALVLSYAALRLGLLLPAPASAPTLTRLLLSLSASQPPPTQPLPRRRLPIHAPQPNTPTPPARAVGILVDDFSPQPYPGESVYSFNRLDGDRGVVNNSELDWGKGEVTTTISAGNTWGGVWMSLNHPIREALPINFSAILPTQILPDYQSQITSLMVRIARGTPHATFRLELKNHGDLQWKHELELTGGDQTIGVDLPPLGNINEFLWVLDKVTADDYVVLDSVSFTATTSITDTATAAFVWSYGQLLNNWNPVTGLVRDKATGASGEFDAIQATGSLAAATAVAEQQGVVSRADAIQVVNQISQTLLLDLPRFHGLWPHFVISQTGVITIAPGTEWSSVDTVIAAIGLLTAQSGLGLDTSGTEQMLRTIDWGDLVKQNGMISHGYEYGGARLCCVWDVFGGESWLVELAYAGATGRVAPLAYPSPPTANGSGFIDELAWLFVLPPARPDFWGIDWASYRLAAADTQIRYYPTHYPTACFTPIGSFGLSAAEVPAPSLVPPGNGIYQAFGVGGRFAPANDGSALFGAPVVVPHYAAMIASLHPQEATRMWNWLINAGYFSPLNNVESLMFPAGSNCDSTSVLWNHMKGSWNLSLQILGWGRHLAERRGQSPILWQSTLANPLLRKGYLLLVPYKAYLPLIFNGLANMS